jgi:hypothetical protein
MPIDTNDDYARMAMVNFALLDNNNKANKKPQNQTKLNLQKINVRWLFLF